MEQTLHTKQGKEQGNAIRNLERTYSSTSGKHECNSRGTREI